VQLRDPIPRVIAATLLSVPVLGTAIAARAAEPAVAADAAPIPVLPTSPAFEAVGANPTTVTRPGAIRSLGTEPRERPTIGSR